jgi:putative transposase
MARRRAKQLRLPIPPGWGGSRAGAGRKPNSREPRVWHVSRPPHNQAHPVLITLRADRGLPSLRSENVFPFMKRALARSNRTTFRVLHFSVQTDHVHLLVEANGRQSLARGIQGLAGRCAKAINRSAHHRGRVWTDRYHARALRTPREVRAALVYVLQNFRKHLRAPPVVDPCSSGAWFDGWTRAIERRAGPPPIRPPSSWLATIGWRRAGGPIALSEAPRPAAPRRVP